MDKQEPDVVIFSCGEYRVYWYPQTHEIEVGGFTVSLWYSEHTNDGQSFAEGFAVGLGLRGFDPPDDDDDDDEPEVPPLPTGGVGRIPAEEFDRMFSGRN